MLYAIGISLVVGFAAGWAFFKHRQNIKDKARADGLALVKSIEKRF